MATPPRSEENLRLAAKTYLDHCQHSLSPWKDGGDLLGWDRKKFRYHVIEAAQKGYLGTEPILPGFTISKTSATYDADGNLKSQSIAQKPEPGEHFQIPEGHEIKGLSTLVGPDGRTVSQWVKTRPGELSIEEITAQIKAGLNGIEHPEIPENQTQTEANLATVLPLADWHIGLLAWHRETGESWDLSIAKQTILRAVSRCINACPPSDTCVVLGLGDMLHFDGYEPITAKSGNHLDTDGRYPKVLRTAADMICSTVEMAAARHKNIIVRILPGNHDSRSALALSIALSMRYENAERVTVDDSPSYFWWWRWGKVFLGATHGDKAKMKDLPLVMAADRPQDWAASTYRKVFTGHIHHERKIEDGGVIVESLRTPVAKDAYHSFERYRSGRSVYAETFDRSGEDVSRVSVNIPAAS